MNPLHHKLPSGRIFLLQKPFTAEELEEANSPEGIALLEAYADAMEARCTKTLTPEDPEYADMLKKHRIKPPTE